MDNTILHDVPSYRISEYIHDTRPSYRLGNMWVLAIIIALMRMGINHTDTSKEYHKGQVPDIVTRGAFIEAKNYIGSVKGRYRIGFK